MAKQIKKSKLKLPKKIVLEINRNTLLTITVTIALLLSAYGLGKANDIGTIGTDIGTVLR
ncbi:MAG: hypothetical protein U9Q63_02120 [Patescibacteria group bacterium]|nr:hypothetical protein [Patescibacteria group bacterium]